MKKLLIISLFLASINLIYAENGNLKDENKLINSEVATAKKKIRNF